MDKVVAFFKNVWVKRSVALLCWAYTALIAWVAWLSFAFFFEYENPTSLFVLYLFVNVAALGLMLYTRKQTITKINSMILPLFVFLIVIFAYGNWYFIAPPLAVVVVMFFANNANETFKTVIGTMYLLMYVIGVAAYIAIDMLMGPITFTGVELQLRDPDYEVLSPSEDYRIVRYVDEPSGDRRIAAYYIEYTREDEEIPFAYCKKVFGCEHSLSSQYTGKADNPVKWVEVDGEEMLSVEGSIRENPYLVVPVSETAESGDALVPIAPFGDGGDLDTTETADTSDISDTAEATSEAA